MADGLDFQLKGFDEVQKKLEALTSQQAKKAYIAAARTSMNATRKKARNKAKTFDDPKTPNQIWKNIITKVNAKRYPTIFVRVGIKGGARQYVNDKRNRRLGRVGKEYEHGGDMYYWRFLEFGTSHASAKPFMRPAMDNQQITDAFKTGLEKAIEKALKK